MVFCGSAVTYRGFLVSSSLSWSLSLRDRSHKRRFMHKASNIKAAFLGSSRFRRMYATKTEYEKATKDTGNHLQFLESGHCQNHMGL